jgi:hypothetical protein
MRRYAEAIDLAVRHALVPFALDAIVGAVGIDVPHVSRATAAEPSPPRARPAQLPRLT